jgi:uncharacterized secreted protein with C-terminal beta-propeller domain
MFSCAENLAGTPQKAKARIGVYDSRAVAVAFAGTEPFNKAMSSLQAEYENAKVAGNQKRVEELEAETVARQQLLHLQAFSTAPVDDILEQIKDSLPEIEQKAGVITLVSKWDKEALAKYPSAELVDVTMMLVDALHPNERQRQIAIDIQKHPPIPPDKAEKIKDW